MQFVVVIIVLLVVIGVFVLARSRRSSDGVAGFRREIDALSSDARRPTIDRGTAQDGPPDDAADAADADREPDPGADAAVEDGPDTSAGGAPGIDPGFIRAQDDPPEADPNGT